jgi:hypothetical protein
MIETETILLPHLLAEPFAREVAPKDANWQRCVDEVTDSLVARAEYLYIHNQSFRSAILKDDESAREYLRMFFNHWAQGWQKDRAHWDKLPKNQGADQPSLFEVSQ